MGLRKTIGLVSDMQHTAERVRLEGKRLAVVPTMGSLHEGHQSLIRLARKHADRVITTIFVNPTQFGAGEDFERYPRDLERDTVLAEEAGTDYLFAPSVKELYPEGYQTYVTVEHLSDILEGEARPGHFRGVATIVAKLFHITKPHVALFGQKDAQQVVVLRRMIRDLNFDTELVVGPTVREHDGLAVSSRNAYLTVEQRRQAPVLFQALRHGEQLLREGQRSSEQIIRAMEDLIRKRSAGSVDYISVTDAETLEELTVCAPGKDVMVSLAVRFGSTRLIDNIIIAC
jgi:pantoate--beta-alanine ligase